jgi:hypothetical protein
MATLRTSQGRRVPHCHVKHNPIYPCDAREFTLAERQQRRARLAVDFPNVVELRAPSRKYNCHGYAFARAHAWFDDPELFIEDDFSEVPFDQARINDVLVYEDASGEKSHSAFVRTVVSGKIMKLRSKWGKLAAVIHDPADVPIEFGQPVRLLRRLQ